MSKPSKHSGDNPDPEDVGCRAEDPHTSDPARYAGPSRVVGIGHACDFSPEAPESGPPRSATVKESQGFEVKEFVELADGRRVIVARSWFKLNLVTELLPDVHTVMPTDNIRQNVLLNLLLDDDLEARNDDRPWQSFAERVREQGIAVTAQELKVLPYEVVLTGEVVRWLLTRG